DIRRGIRLPSALLGRSAIPNGSKERSSSSVASAEGWGYGFGMPRIQWDAKTSKGEGEVFGNNEGKRAGIVLIQEYWGLNDHIRDVAGRYAKEGFVVLAVDLFHGQVTKDAGEAGKL